ncbi:Fur family transcriptional regulator [uncultured Aureimonas sp.]|uniref:Fur family transcriptional regulator n=1 Tax=uncultured Aureimonas sp. TaxID=1604662 RepID=UPI0025E06057|nr:Fur family transcriptional regulator [uncultured Aureimonas sp.]
MSHDHHHHTSTAGAEKALTRNQKLVFDILEQADGPLSAYSILDALRDEGLRAPPQVYRALEKLLETGLVHRLESLNAFVACAHPHACAYALTAFAICEKCGAVTEFADAAVEARLAGWAGERGFVPKRTTVEIKGLCAACA